MSNAFSFEAPGVPFHALERPKFIASLADELFVVPPTRAIEVVCQAYALTHAELIGPARWANIMVGRVTAYWLLRTVCGLSFPQIGRVMAKDHTTVMSGVKKAERRRETDLLYKRQTDMLVERMKGATA